MSKYLFRLIAVCTIVAVAACAPATEPTVSPGSTPQTGGGNTPQATAPPSGQQTPSAASRSVSGIPLDPNAKFGGELNTTVSGEGPTFSTWEESSGNPAAVVDPTSNWIVATQSWGTQEEIAGGAYFNVVPDLATSWEQSADGLQWTFQLRDGVTWSDGVPFTCADAQWSLDTIRTGQGLQRSPRATHLLAVESIECASDLTLVINMQKPKPGLLNVIAMPYNPVRPKHVYENNTDLMRAEPPKAVTGPFQVREWIPGERTVLERRADYWDQPFPYLDGINVFPLGTSAQDAGLRSGRLDFGPRQGYSGPRLVTLQQGCSDCIFFDTIVNPSLSPAVMVNHARAPWSDPAVQTAIGYAIDRVKYNKLVQLDDFALPSGGFFVPGSGWEMPYERVKQVPGYNFEDPEGNKQKARDLLAQAGYEPNELTVKVAFWSVIQTDAPPIIEDLNAVGIQAEAEILETGRAYEAWGSGNFDIGVHSFWYTTADPDEVLFEHFYTGSERNYNRYSNPEVDRLIEEMSVTVDPELRKQRAWDVAEMIMREQGKILVTFGTFVPVTGPRVRGWTPASGWLAISGSGARSQHVWLDQS
jgi:peptide/nickel transport system substrate-binding protein